MRLPTNGKVLSTVCLRTNPVLIEYIQLMLLSQWYAKLIRDYEIKYRAH